jgi:hypothetical protein
VSTWPLLLSEAAGVTLALCVASVAHEHYKESLRKRKTMFNKIKTSIHHQGSFGGVVRACYETCEEPICFVTYAQVGQDFVITSFGVSSHATAKETQKAGDEIDRMLEREAGPLGVKRLLLVHPNQDTAEVVRTYEVQPWCLANSTTPSAKYLN